MVGLGVCMKVTRKSDVNVDIFTYHSKGFTRPKYDLFTPHHLQTAIYLLRLTKGLRTMSSNTFLCTCFLFKKNSKRCYLRFVCLNAIGVFIHYLCSVQIHFFKLSENVPFFFTQRPESIVKFSVFRSNSRRAFCRIRIDKANNYVLRMEIEHEPLHLHFTRICSSE